MAGGGGGADAAAVRQRHGLQGCVLRYARESALVPYEAKVWRGGKPVHLGTFATAEEAALCYAKTVAEQSSMVDEWLNL